jgi:arylsulfatase A-like enzyme
VNLRPRFLWTSTPVYCFHAEFRVSGDSNSLCREPPDRSVMMTQESDAKYPAWRTASLPFLLLIGIALPLYFLTWVEKYLYYLQPIELLPTYATAWLFLAAAAIPAWLIASLILKVLAARGNSRATRIFAIFLVGIGAVSALSAFLYCVFVWLLTFGLRWDASVGHILVGLALTLGVVTALTARGWASVERLRAVAVWSTAIGAASLLSIPFFTWTAADIGAGTRVVSKTQVPALRPHIVLLTIDTVSAERMSLYGAGRPTTPMLSALARNATTFEHAYANGNFTTAGVGSILTGTRPWTHRALQLTAWPNDSTRRQSLPALLRQSGYQTVYVSTNPFAGAAKNGMAGYFDKGFSDRIKDLSPCSDLLSHALKYACSAAELPLFVYFHKLQNLIVGPRDNLQFDPRLAVGSALQWLEHANTSTPIFLWVHLFPPHSPYAAPQPWLGRFDSSNYARLPADSEPMQQYLQKLESETTVRTLEARYDESLEYVDQYAGEFIRRALQLLGDNTVVVVTADHGESFSHHYGAHGGPGLYDEIIHIPLVLKLPGQLRPAWRSDVVEQVDIAPTLARIAGVEPPSSWEGRSLLSDSARSSEPPPTGDKPVFSMNFEENQRTSKLTTGSVAVVDGHWKLVRYFGSLHYPLMPRMQVSLYDLSSDPGELVNRAAADPEIVSRLSALIATELARHGGPAG